MRSYRSKFAVMAALSWTLLGTPAQLHAQPPAVTTDVVAGEPFGVGKVVLAWPIGKGTSLLSSTQPASAPSTWEYGAEAVLFESTHAWRLAEKQGRIFYPAITVEVSRESEATGRQIVIYFLFRGDGPLELTLAKSVGSDRASHAATTRPAAEQAQHRQLLNEWWAAYGAMVQDIASSDFYSPVVENYVMNMLASRLQLKPPAMYDHWFRGDAWEIVGLLTGAESIRVAMQRDTLLATTQQAQKADKPLPKAATLPAVQLPPVAADVAVEPIAAHVPVECFYLRCGSFPNFQWLRALTDDWGGTTRNLASLRSMDYGLKDRLERQLSLKETVLSKLFGDKVIADVAIIGTDTFIREGAAIGILFEAKNSQLLSAQIGQQRKAAMAADKEASDQQVNIAGHKVSLLSTPDNSVRSFYAADGDYHLVTTSRRIVERFFEASSGKGALADSKEFKYARTYRPLASNDTLFIYLSDPFFRTLVSPQYRVEMTRRMKSLGDIELVHLAMLAAKGEGAPADTIDKLIEGQFLPKGFNSRPDGSKLVVRNGRVIDTLRGGRGTFLPVPDVDIAGLTESEVDAYEGFVESYRRQWERMDPVIITINPSQGGAAGVEHIVVDLHATPYAKTHYGMVSNWLGKPSHHRIAPVEGDILAADVTMPDESRPGNKLDRLAHALTPSPHIFAGLRDFELPFAIDHGRVVIDYPWATNSPAYFGQTTGYRGLISIWHIDDEVDAEGYGQSGGSFFSGKDSWIRKTTGFDVTAQTKELLQTVTPQLKLEPTSRPAQIRVRTGDLSKTKVVPALNALGYLHARQTSAGGTYLIEALSQQLHVKPADSLDAAQEVVGARIVCPLGGQYKYDAKTDRWFSTAWESQSLADVSAVPANYRFPILDVVRSFYLEFSINETALSTHFEVDIKRK